MVLFHQMFLFQFECEHISSLSMFRDLGVHLCVNVCHLILCVSVNGCVCVCVFDKHVVSTGEN